MMPAMMVRLPWETSSASVVGTAKAGAKPPNQKCGAAFPARSATLLHPVLTFRSRRQNNGLQHRIQRRPDIHMRDDGADAREAQWIFRGRSLEASRMDRRSKDGLYR